MTSSPSRLLSVVAFISLVTGACLPRGGPPAGRQIVADPTAALLGLVPPNGDGLLRVLFFRPAQSQNPDRIDLWVAAVDASGGPSAEMLLFTDLMASYELSYRPSAGSTGFPFDGRGRLYVYADDLFRIDPVTGQKDDLGPTAGFVTASASGERILFFDRTGGYVLGEADDSTREIASRQAMFVGDTLYYVSLDCDLMRLAPGGAPEQLATDVLSFSSSYGSLLLLFQTIPQAGVPASAACDPSMRTFNTPHTSAFLDTTTLEKTMLPADLYFDQGRFSPDGRWICTSQVDLALRRSEFVIYDRLTGAIESLGPNVQFAEWRPGHDEVWASVYDSTQPGLTGAALLIKKPGAPAVTVPGVYPYGFNEDGRYWFSRTTPPDELAASQLVGIADDPSGPRYRVVPEGSSVSTFWTLDDGRMVTGSETDPNDFRHDTYQVIDPGTGATQVVGLRGYLSAAGNSRLLGIFHYNFERGDLTSVDFTSGHSTVLASEFAMAAIAEAPGPDFYPPASRIVYQFRARFESPWSGLWLATAP